MRQALREAILPTSKFCRRKDATMDKKMQNGNCVHIVEVPFVAGRVRQPTGCVLRASSSLHELAQNTSPVGTPPAVAISTTGRTQCYCSCCHYCFCSHTTTAGGEHLLRLLPSMPLPLMVLQLTLLPLLLRPCCCSWRCYSQSGSQLPLDSSLFTGLRLGI